ncbi:MAG: COX15/CtaA family protein [Rhodobacteraceae bacterium]|nr:COX15/CtaA family protein [Paracoccaceae bacterium]
MIERGPRGARSAVRVWLGLLFVLVMAMIAVGGLTRLTDSGLSITEWRPLAGALPPIGTEAWMREFAAYQQSPEFRLQNSTMTLDAFKSIYWWEWSHRQLGRVIGLVWALGFFGFWALGRIPPGWKGKLLALGFLGGAQGAIGWWMVASGLTGDAVDVASYRLATHLGLAFAILGLIAVQIFELTRSEAALMVARRSGEARLVRVGGWLAAIAFVQILLGALVAGIDAGRGFPTWPLMNGSFFPADAFVVPGGGAAWRALFENPGLVQFLHRLAGYVLLVAVFLAWWRARTSAQPTIRAGFGAVALMTLAQAVLGIFTALYAAPLALGLAHQLGAVVLWVLILRARAEARAPHAISIRGTR